MHTHTYAYTYIYIIFLSQLLRSSSAASSTKVRYTVMASQV